MVSRALIMCLLLGIAWSSLAQQLLDADLMDMSDGFAHRDIRYATRDVRGFLWAVGSDIDLYDGSRFTRFNKFSETDSLPISGIRFACGLGDSLIVFSASRDLYFLNMNTRNSGAFPFPKDLPTDFFDIVAIVDRQNHDDILFITRDDATTYVNLINRDWEHLYTYEIPKEDQLRTVLLRAIAGGRSGDLWLMDQMHNRIIRASKQGVTQIPVDLSPGKSERMHRIVYRPGYGIVIIGNDGQIHGIQDGSDRVESLLQVDIPGEILNTVHVGQDGRIWVICPKRVIRFDIETGASEVFYQSVFGDFVPPVHNSIEDSEGIVWFSTEIGLLRINKSPVPFRTYLVQPAGSHYLQFRDVLPGPEPNTLFARININGRQLLEMRFNNQGGMDTVVIERNSKSGGIYRRHGSYVYHIQPNSDQLKRIDLRDHSVRKFTLPERSTTQYYNFFTIDSNGTILYQNYNNNLTILRPDGSTDILTLERSNTLLASQWKFMEYHNGHYFIGTETMGLGIYDSNTGALLSHYDNNTDPALSSNLTNCMVLDSDTTLWVGTLGSGLNAINLSDNTIQHYTTLDGLPNHQIASLLSDDEGNIWIGTYDGLSMFDKDQGTFFNFYEKDGISCNEFNYLAAYKNEEGKMFFGSWNGMTVFDPHDMIESVTLPPVQVTSVEKYNHRKRKLDVAHPSADTRLSVDVSPYDTYVQFQFAIPSFRDNASHQFRTRLMGIDPAWQSHGTNSTVRYQKLPAGYYTLEVMGVDGMLNETSEITSIRMHVRQPFYKSAWFFALVGMAVFIGIYTLYRYRLSVLEQQQNMRSRIAADLHDEIGGSLTAVSMQLQLLEDESMETSKAKLRALGHKINDSASKMRDLVWSIDTSSDTWSDIVERMYECAYDLLHPAEIQFEITTEGLDANSSPSPRVKQNLYMLYKESINNITKHSNASHVEILLSLKQNVVTLKIHDNGSRTESTKKQPGHGQSSMTMRAKRLNGNLKSGWHAEGGYLVLLTCPMI